MYQQVYFEDIVILTGLFDFQLFQDRIFPITSTHFPSSSQSLYPEYILLCWQLEAFPEEFSCLRLQQFVIPILDKIQLNSDNIAVGLLQKYCVDIHVTSFSILKSFKSLTPSYGHSRRKTSLTNQNGVYQDKQTPTTKSQGFAGSAQSRSTRYSSTLKMPV